ncbi:VWA domain-containing protein, partial [Candidatus Desantisbacteria bacterium]|nr:VWA domain-containing protein [Candidatus Desantisbacteria bacterium]
IEYLNKYSNIKHYPINISERIIIKVKDINGKSIPNAVIKIFGDDKIISSGLTYSDGSFLFFPSENNEKIFQYNAVISYMQSNTKIEFDRQGKREIEVKLDFQKSIMENIPLDILFILDVTSSMSEEIERLKATMEIIKLNIASISSKPAVRFGMVLYRDRGDNFITQITPLTKDLNIFQHEINEVTAMGGRDEPEDLQAALKDTIETIEWNKDGIRLGFIITDAPPHLDYGQKYTYVHAASDAKRKGIKLFSVGTGGLNSTGEYILRQISQYTSSKYIFLTYGEKGESEGGAPGSVSHHTGENYQTDKLEAIIIKIAKEELSHFTDQPFDSGEDYFEANKIGTENKEETLQKLFSMAISQLLDYSTYKIEEKIPTGMLPIISKETSQNANAEYFTEQLIFSLMKNNKLKVVERKDMQSIMKELELSETGLMDDTSAVKVGNLLGAKLLVSGNIYKKDNCFELFLKLLRVETGEILSITKLKVDLNLGL